MIVTESEISPQTREGSLYITPENYEMVRNVAGQVGISDDLWQSAREYITPFLSGRPGFEHHTAAVIYYTCDLALHDEPRPGESLNPKVLFLAAALHDIGYKDVLPGSTKVTDPKMLSSEVKNAHMERGTARAGEFLSQAQQRGLLSADEVVQVLHIVKVHDRKDLEVDEPREVAFFVAADTLGALDQGFGKPSFAKDKLTDWWKKSMGGIRELREGKWKTTKSGRWDKMPTLYAQKRCLQLSEKLLDYVEE